MAKKKSVEQTFAEQCGFTDQQWNAIDDRFTSNGEGITIVKDPGAEKKNKAKKKATKKKK